MPDGFEEELGQTVPEWVDEGLITGDQAQAILERHGTQARKRPGSARSTDGASDTDWTSTLLYGTAGVLLGAAALALVLVGIEPDESLAWLVALGGLLVGAGVLLEHLVPVRRLLGEAVLAAGLVPLAVAGADGSGDWLLVSAAVGMGVPLAYLWWKREQGFLPTLSVIAFAVAAGINSFKISDAAGWDSGTATFLWAGLALGLVVVVVAIDRLLRETEGGAHVALAVVALAIALVPMLFEGFDVNESENVELILGGLLSAVLVTGLALRHRGVVVGASVALGVDAIVFAFDVGGVWLGVGTLVALAAALIWQAETVKSWFAEPV